MARLPSTVYLSFPGNRNVPNGEARNGVLERSERVRPDVLYVPFHPVPNGEPRNGRSGTFRTCLRPRVPSRRTNAALTTHQRSVPERWLNLEASEVGTVRLGPCTVGWALGRKPTLGKWRHSAWLPSGLVLVSPTSSEHACPTSGLLCGWLRVCGSCREHFAAQRVGEEVSSDVSLCTSYQS